MAERGGGWNARIRRRRRALRATSSRVNQRASSSSVVSMVSSRRSRDGRGSRSSATTGTATAGWRHSGRRRRRCPASSVKLAGDRGLDRFAGLDEAGERRIAAGRILRLAAEQDAAVMLGEHDHDRVDAREMLGAAGRAAPRPAAAHDVGRWPQLAQKRWRAVPAGKAERGGEQRRIALVELRQQRQRPTRLVAGRGERAEARRAAVEAEEQRRVAASVATPAGRRRRAPEARRSIPARARRSLRRARRSRPASARSASARSRPGPGEERLRRQGVVLAGQAQLGGACGRASAGRPRRAGRAAATSPRRPARARGRRARSSAKWVKTWRTLPSAGSVDCGASLQSLPGQRGHSAEQASGRPADQPDAAVALDPPGDAVAVRPRAPRACGAGKASGVAARASARNRAASGQSPQRGALRAADRRAEVHHRLGEIARRGPRASCRDASASISARDGCSSP